MKLKRKLFCNNCKYINEALQIVDNKTREYNMLNETFSHFKTLSIIQELDLLSEQIIFIEENSKHCDYLLVTVQTETNYRGLISGINFYCYALEKGMFVPEKVMRMFTELHYSIDFFIDRIEIVDILGTPNKGYGSIILEAFFGYIQQFHAREVFGMLSYVDEKDLSNKERRNHFYTKHGFTITDNYISKTFNK